MDLIDKFIIVWITFLTILLVTLCYIYYNNNKTVTIVTEENTNKTNSVNLTNLEYKTICENFTPVKKVIDSDENNCYIVYDKETGLEYYLIFTDYKIFKIDYSLSPYYIKDKNNETTQGFHNIEGK